MNYFFCATSTFFCWHETFSSNINLFLSTQDYFLCNVKHFVLTQNCFSCNTKFLFWTPFRMLSLGDVFLFSRSNKNIITYEKKIIFMWHKKINFVFCAWQIFYIFSFHIAHWQHVDLLPSGPRNKETSNPSFTHLSDIPKQLLSKSCSGKNKFLI